MGVFLTQFPGLASFGCLRGPMLNFLVSSRSVELFDLVLLLGANRRRIGLHQMCSRGLDSVQMAVGLDGISHHQRCSRGLDFAQTAVDFDGIGHCLLFVKNSIVPISVLCLPSSYLSDFLA